MTMELAESSVPEVKLINMERAMEIDSDVFMKKIDSSIEYEGREEAKLNACVFINHNSILYPFTCSSRDPDRQACFHGNRCMVSRSSSVYTVSM